MRSILVTRIPRFAILLLVCACTERPLPPDCGNQCEPYGPEFPGVGECQEGQCTPTFFECFAKDEYDTCSAACAAAGSVCAENQCADSTYLITVHIDSCLQPETVGVARKGGCDEPIGWQVNTGARCCCEQL